MALKQFKYRRPNADDVQFQVAVLVDHPAFADPVVTVSMIPPSTITLEYDDQGKGDLDDAMAELGWIFDSEVTS